MSAESAEWLNTYQLIGYTDALYGRGNAWHDNKALRVQLGIEENHYAHAIPVDDVLRRLFNWKALEADVVIRATDEHGTIIEAVDHNRKAIVRSDDHLQCVQVGIPNPPVRAVAPQGRGQLAR